VSPNLEKEKEMSCQTLMTIPPEVHWVIKRLEAEGYEAYLVGGCVRDKIMGKEPKDWDITTKATPGEIASLFERTIDTGIKHGTVTVVSGDTNIEVTTYRVDGEYNDSRHPSSIEFASSLIEDLSRRDFTMNAMAYHPERGLIDPFDGFTSIREKTIKTVGDAEKRFEEDALRMLRAVRFSAQLNFNIEDKVLHSIKEKSQIIKKISSERIRDELTGILVSDYPMRFIILRDTQLLQHILPEFEICFHTSQNHPNHIYNVAVHSLHSVKNIEPVSELRWTMLLHDIGKPLVKTIDEHGIEHFYCHHIMSLKLAKNILKRLKFSNSSISKISSLIKHHDRFIEPSFKAVRKAISTLGEDIFCHLMQVRKADIKAQNPQFLEERLLQLQDINNIYLQIKDEGQCLSVKDMAINGEHLLSLGFKEGKEIGKILNDLLELVIENPELNYQEKLIEIVYQKFINN
jgi:tRNA nucleotidyltransferase (CCA-adding enzyme)